MGNSLPPAGPSFWREEVLSSHAYPILSHDYSTEVCIIGAGIAGLTTAYLLLKAGCEVAVLESRTVGAGESGNTTAHLSNALDDRYFNLIKMHGIEKAKLAAASHTEAIHLIEKIVHEEKIDCDFKKLEGFLFAHEKNAVDQIEKEFEAAKSCGLEVEMQEVLPFGKVVVFPNQAQFHPLKYLNHLAEKITQMGGEIFQLSRVKEIKQNQLEIITKEDWRVKAKKIVIAANSPLFADFSMLFKVDPRRSYVIGIPIPKESIPHKLYWDTADPYHYVRLQAYDKHRDIIIIGGEDHRVGFQPKNDPFQNLFNWAKNKFPHISADISYKWSGQVIEPVDYLAYIGVNPKNKNIFMVTGDSGNGLTHGTIAGKLISDLILNKKNDWSKVYKQNRLPFRAWKHTLLNIIISSFGYIKYFYYQKKLPLSPGHGKVVQCGFKKIARYCDESGEMKEFSAICSHLGGVLSWNPIEKSWDCPAHGSRFNLEGSVLNGPAKKH